MVKNDHVMQALNSTSLFKCSCLLKAIKQWNITEVLGLYIV